MNILTKIRDADLRKFFGKMVGVLLIGFIAFILHPETGHLDYFEFVLGLGGFIIVAIGSSLCLRRIYPK